MTNTTSPAESIGAPSGAASFYRWEVAGKPIQILFSLDLMDRLERDVIESFKAVTKKGSEIGGVLGGRVIAGSQPTVIIEQFEAVECDYSRGPLYLLADEDKARMKQALSRVGSAGSVAGFFRSNTRRELVLDEEDQALAKEFFADPNNVFLLVRPFAMKPSAGGFFFWENGQIQGEACYLQFPFKRAELAKNFAQFIVAAPEAPPPAREPLMMPKREERPAPPPVALKREEPKPAAVVPPRREEPAPPPPPPAALRREESKREEPAAAPPPPVFKREEPRPSPVIPPRREETTQLNFRREERPPVAKREEPPAPPKREERPAPPVILKREERQPAAPAPPKREERPSGPTLVSKREEQPAPPPAAVVPPPAVVAPPPAAVVPPPPVTPKKEEKPPAPVVTARREERPPVIVRREEKPAVTPVVQKREEPAPAKPEEKPVVAKPPEAVVVAPARKEEPVKAEPVKVKAEPVKREPVKAEPVVAAAAAVPAERISLGAPEESQPGLFSRFKWAIVAVVLVVLLGGGYFLFFRTGGTGGEPAKLAETSLGLNVESNTGQLLLTWNRNSPLIVNATQATLTITDGDHQEDVPLDLALLHSGSVVYPPISNDVNFRLEVTDAKSGKTKAESVRRLAPRPSPSVPADASRTQPQVGRPGPGATDARPATTQTTAAAPVPTPQVATPTVSAGPSVTFQPPKPGTLAARLIAPEVPAGPNLDTSTNTLGGTAPIGSGSGSALPAPPPNPGTTARPPVAPPSQSSAVRPPAPVTTTPVQPQVKSPGTAQEARVVTRAAAVYPPLAKQARITGIVRVHAVVGKNGRVKKATALSGPQMLRQAAVDSVMKWVYSPAILNGEPVEAETQVDVNFMM